jgi:hypothetical protein
MSICAGHEKSILRKGLEGFYDSKLAGGNIHKFAVAIALYSMPQLANVDKYKQFTYV